MNIAVLASLEEAIELVSVLETLKGLGIPAYGLKMKGGWEDEKTLGLSSRLEKATHILLLSSPESSRASWFLFTSGYGMGKGIHLAIYRLKPSWEIPAYLARLPLIDGLTELGEYYRLESLEWGAQDGRRVARATLLELGISFHADSLVRCVEEGDIHAVELFLKAGFHPDSRDKHGVPLLCLAARNKHLAVAELLLEYGASLDLQSEDRGFSALMDACLVGVRELVSLFLSHGANPNLLSKDGQTALIVAVGKGDAEVSKLLLEAGAEPDVADKLGISARKYATLFKRPELLSLFSEEKGR